MNNTARISIHLPHDPSGIFQEIQEEQQVLRFHLDEISNHASGAFQNIEESLNNLRIGLEDLKGRWSAFKTANPSSSPSNGEGMLEECEELMQLISQIGAHKLTSPSAPKATLPEILTSKESFFRFLDNPVPYLEPRGTGQLGLKGFPFSECCCDGYDRRIRPMRLEIEKYLVNQFIERFPDKSQTPMIMSLGSGGLLQDLILVGKLYQAGFKSLNLSLFEPFATSSNPDAFAKFFLAFPDLKLTVTDVPQSQFDFGRRFLGTMDAIIAIDFTELNQEDKSGWKAFIRGREFLKTDGRLYHDNEYSIDKKGEFQFVRISSENLYTLVKSHPNFRRLKQDNRISICLRNGRNQNFPIPRICKLLEKLNKSNFKEIHLVFQGKYTSGVSFPHVLKATQMAELMKELVLFPILCSSSPMAESSADITIDFGAKEEKIT